MHPLTKADAHIQKGKLALILAKNAEAYAEYMKAAKICEAEFKGMNWFGDKLENNSEMAVADCLLGAGAAQYAMGYSSQP